MRGEGVSAPADDPRTPLIFGQGRGAEQFVIPTMPFMGADFVITVARNRLSREARSAPDGRG